MTKKLFLCAAFLIISAPSVSYSSNAEQNNLAVEVATDHIDVTGGFTGASIELFGDRRDKKTDVAIVIEGPRKKVTIWEKSRVMGAWMNRHYATFKEMPTYYHFATTFDVASENFKKLMSDNGVGHDGMFSKQEKKTSKPVDEIKIFEKALLDRKIRSGVYFSEQATVNFINDNFFRVSFPIPPSAPTGQYTIRSYLIKGGKIIEERENIIKVEQVGFNAFVFSSAHNFGLIYACVCIFLAMFSGWIASVLRVKP